MLQRRHSNSKEHVDTSCVLNRVHVVESVRVRVMGSSYINVTKITTVHTSLGPGQHIVFCSPRRPCDATRDSIRVIVAGVRGSGMTSATM